MTVAFALDGSNLCAKHGTKQFNFARLEMAVDQIRRLCFDLEIEVRIFVDASLKYKLDPNDKSSLEDQISDGTIIMTPAGVTADSYLLHWSDQHNAIVVSNDLFREYKKKYPWLGERENGRCVTGVFDESQKSWTFMERNAGIGIPRGIEELAREANSKNTPVVRIQPDDSPFTFQNDKDNYVKSVDRQNPTAILILLDQSQSMGQFWGPGGYTKAERLAKIVNDILRELVLQCTRGETGEVRPYFDIGVIGYGSSLETPIVSMFSGTTTEDPFISIAEVWARKEMRDSGKSLGGRKKPVWIDPIAVGNTPMCRAFKVSKDALAKWISIHQSSFPPIVFNITDGAPTDGNPADSAHELTSLSTNDGNVLLFTAHVMATSEEVIRYPESLDVSMSPNAHIMFNITSLVPKPLRETAKQLGISIPSGGRGFLFNSEADDVVAMLNVGTQGATVAEK